MLCKKDESAAAMFSASTTCQRCSLLLLGNSWRSLMLVPPFPSPVPYHTKTERPASQCTTQERSIPGRSAPASHV